MFVSLFDLNKRRIEQAITFLEDFSGATMYVAQKPSHWWGKWIFKSSGFLVTTRTCHKAFRNTATNN